MLLFLQVTIQTKFTLNMELYVRYCLFHIYNYMGTSEIYILMCFIWRIIIKHPNIKFTFQTHVGLWHLQIFKEMTIKVKKTISWKFIYIFCEFWQTNLPIFSIFGGFFLYFQNSWIVTHEHKSRSPSNVDYFWGKFCSYLKSINMLGLI